MYFIRQNQIASMRLMPKLGELKNIYILCQRSQQRENQRSQRKARAAHARWIFR
jgi:hypothetical protein